MDGNLNVGNGIDLTGNLITTGYVDVADTLRMKADKKLFWDDSYTFISGNATSMDIDGDANLNLEAGTLIKLTSPTTTVSGNLNVGNSIDLTGNLIATGYVDVATTLRMKKDQKLFWHDSYTHISGNATSLTIAADENFTLSATDTSLINTPSFYIQGASGNSAGLNAELTIKSRGNGNGLSLLTMISDNGYDKGDSCRFQYLNGTLSFLTDHSVKGTIDQTLFTITGNISGVADSLISLLGKLNVSGLCTFSDHIKLTSSNQIYWGNTENVTYISGTSTGLTVESNDTLTMNSDASTTVNTPILTVNHTSHTDFVIRSSASNNGQARLTLISDNADNKGCSFQIKTLTNTTTFSTDHNTLGTYDRPILTLTGHITQSSRKAQVYGKLEVYNGISVDFGSDAEGDMFYRNSLGDFTRLPKGGGGQFLKMNDGGTVPEWGSSSGGVTISNNVNNRVLTGDGTNANAEANMTFSGSALNVVGTISCDTSLTIDSSVLDASDILHISDITAGTATASKALVLNSLKNLVGISTLGCARLTNTLSISTSSNSNLELNPHGSGKVVFKGGGEGTHSGRFVLNCENNSHGITIEGPPHEAGAGYTLTLPSSAGDEDQVLKTDGSGNLSWTTVSGGGVTMSGSSSNGVLTYNSSNEATVESTLLYDGTSLNIGTSGVFAGGVTIYKTGYISIRNQLRFYGTSQSGTSPYISFSAPTTVPSTLNFILPSSYGNDGQLLKTDGSGNLSWTTVTGGGGGGGGGDLPTGLTYTSSIFTVTGNIRATQDITAYYSSDRRFKDNLTRISDPNEKIKKINGYEFDWNEKHELYKNTHDVGVVAQEIEEVLPEVVAEREDGYKAVKYEKIIALLIESNKDLLRRVEELEEKVKKA